MPNWCENNVKFIGEAKQIEAAKSLFEKAKTIEEETGKGVDLVQLLNPKEESQVYYFLNQVSDNNDGYNVMFLTKHAPAMIPLVLICDALNLEFIHYAFEPINRLMYVSSYTNKSFNSLSFDEEEHEFNDVDEFLSSKAQELLD